jgi:hypothetical protein
MLPMRSVLLASLFVLLSTEVRGLGEVVFAVNCGGDEHTDVFGIKYAKDINKVSSLWQSHHENNREDFLSLKKSILLKRYSKFKYP